MLQFVSAFMDLREDRYSPETRTIDRYFELFTTIAETGIPIHVFLPSHLAERLSALSYPNVTVEVLEFEEMDIYKTVYSIPNLQLPPERNAKKDTKQYLTFMNAKIEFVRRAMERNTDATHFAWLDFGLAHVFRNPTETLAYLNQLTRSVLPSHCLYMPGCWQFGAGMYFVNRCIVWRFAGGFFLGDRSSLQGMWELYQREFGRLIAESKILVWEVNMWAIMEMHSGFRPNWYGAGHDDQIVRIPRPEVSDSLP